MDRNWTVAAEPVAAEPEVAIPTDLEQVSTVDQLHAVGGHDVLNIAQQPDESNLLRDVDEPGLAGAADDTDEALGRLPEVSPLEQVSAPPSLSAALNPTDGASAAAAVPLFPNVDLEVLEETQADMNITRFVVLSQARSGSTWLASMLNSHPNVLAFGEYLSSWAGQSVDGDGLACKPQERLAKLDNMNHWKQCSEWNFADKRKWIDAAKTGPVAMGLCVRTGPTSSKHT